MALKRPIKTAGEAVEQAALQVNLLMREFRNGFTVYVQKVPGNPHSIMDFVMGRCDELPIALKIEPKERT